ncbi:serine/threonine transporter SstT [Streptococcus infantarius]|uniref:serine/threonine transporter SstT n=1 Tax=Streptococcus infantarius TaxID=102684 RepID=UPI00024DCE55|nr:serine/threonine transporter SstT [Streptococcus infantarius]AEZ62872.1 sodium:dicarboxylate symporter family protein [Streptococcus infantarius subsp. infantarius CJ18]MCO4473299.1 sodium:dicarboxylate symporter family protein [Streptococcus infantarius subsp. infantarius]MCO4498285.1 sodium:dicarboxylate symporter family protein [Streptococcus infantarius subsp. infantarius]MCO4519528.1 sodium:dicarboxylate symporter family protein [Streptococcus infantarius subsp. infantarius]MCO4635659.
MKRFINVWNRTSLIKRIIIGVILGFILGMTLPKVSAIGILGDLFVGGLKAVAPLLVFVLVASALSQNEKGQKTNMSTIIGLYLVGTLAAALVAVVVNYFFPITLTLDTATQPKLSSPEGVGQVFHSLLLQMVDNPINALGTANYIGVLTWAVIFGLAFRNSNKETKELLQTIADVTSQVVRWIINLVPFGILGLVFKTISDNGVKILANYGFLILALVGTMLFVALVINPFIAFLFMRKNPYPLVFRCLKDSGLTAFFTRSSAANIPVNMKLCEELGLNKDTYKVSIPLGATINMGGAAITINVLTLAAVNTLGIHVDFPTALLLSVLSAVSACGASGVTGGSLLLVPVACSLFGISNDLAMQVVGVGFIVGVVQDSCETALNSSTDVLFTAVAEKSVWGKKKKVN